MGACRGWSYKAALSWSNRTLNSGRDSSPSACPDFLPHLRSTVGRSLTSDLARPLGSIQGHPTRHTVGAKKIFTE